MKLNAFLDNFGLTISSLFMRKKYFRDTIDSHTLEEHLQAISIEMPSITDLGHYELKADTLVGELSPAFRIEQWKGNNYSTIIYHHGAAEGWFDYSFKKIFPAKKIDIPANLIVIRAPFNKSNKEFMENIKHLSNYVAMLAVSVKLTELLVQYNKEIGVPCVVVTGVSLGGIVTNLHHTFLNSADLYKPLFGGVEVAEVFLNSAYAKIADSLAKENPEKIREILNFNKAFENVDKRNVFPILGRHDQIFKFEREKKYFTNGSLVVLEKGHATGATAFKELREHILKDLEGHNSTNSV